MAEIVVHRVKAPDGTILKIQGPADATPEEINEYASKIYSDQQSSGKDDREAQRILILQDEFRKANQRMLAAEEIAAKDPTKENRLAYDRSMHDMDALRRELIKAGGEESIPEMIDAGANTPPPTREASEEDFNAMKLRLAMDAAGAVTGAAAAKVSDVGRGVIGGARDIVRASRTLPGALSVLESLTKGGGQPPAMPSAPAAPIAPTPQVGAARPAVGGPAGPVGGPPAPLTQAGGTGTYNYGKAFGLTDIEAGRALDMSKNPGGANDLIRQRAEGLQRIQQMGGGFTENPRYGGIMTPQQTAGGGPRASFVQGPGGLTQLPPTAPIPSAPPPVPKPSPLSQAAGAVKQGAGAVLRSPVLSGALGGLSMAESAQEAERLIRAEDTTGAGIAGAGAIGGAMQIFAPPPLKMVGALISAASPLTLYLRENLRKQTPMPEPTAEQMQQAQRPAFGVYPAPMSRSPLRPRIPQPGTNLPPVEFMQ